LNVTAVTCYPGDPVKQRQTLPVFEYDHQQGCSIIGGYVYRGSAIPELRGRHDRFRAGWLRSFSMTMGSLPRSIEYLNIGSVLSLVKMRRRSCICCLPTAGFIALLAIGARDAL
jgi:hypothetical protein